MRLKEYVDYATAAGDSVTEIQFVRIAYSLVVDTGQFQEDCQTWPTNSEPEKASTKLQAHFIKSQADFREQQQTY